MGTLFAFGLGAFFCDLFRTFGAKNVIFYTYLV